jgi:hypothetical protein
MPTLEKLLRQAVDENKVSVHAGGHWTALLT